MIGVDPEPSESRSDTEATPRGLSLPLLVGVAAAVLLLDQLSKLWAVDALGGGRTIDLVWTLRFNLVTNPGSAFSIGGGTWWGPFVTVVALVVVGLLVWHARVLASRVAVVAAGAVVGGAVGNLIDRAVRDNPRDPDAGFLGGAVIDFIDLQWWPVFNIADMAVVLGGLTLLVVSLRAEAGHPEEPTGSSGGDRSETPDGG